MDHRNPTKRNFLSLAGSLLFIGSLPVGTSTAVHADSLAPANEAQGALLRLEFTIEDLKKLKKNTKSEWLAVAISVAIDVAIRVYDWWMGRQVPPQQQPTNEQVELENLKRQLEAERRARESERREYDGDRKRFLKLLEDLERDLGILRRAPQQPQPTCGQFQYYRDGKCVDARNR